MSTSSSTKNATSMAELMARQSAAPVTFKKGDKVKGIVTRLSKKEILVNLSAKGEAIVIEKDPRLMKSLKKFVKEGDEVEATIISVESESGQPVVSLRNYVNNLMWNKIEALKKNQEPIQVNVTEVTRGGYVVVSDEGFS